MAPKTPKPKAPKASKTKPIAAPKPATVGQTLKTRRLAKGLSLKDVELATKVRGKYLIAIESDTYDAVPHDVYTRGFVQSYADFMQLDGKATAEAYLAERGQQQLQLRRESSITTPRFVLTPRLLTSLGGILAATVIATYLVFQVNSLTAPPKLTITNPAKDQVLYGSLIALSGRVDGGADVFVNDTPILVDGTGTFTDSIALHDGINAIRVSAKNRLGKATTVTRSILAKVPPTDPASLLPAAPFDGVAVSVAVQQSATTITVTIDGKQTFHGTMLPGTTQTFKGAQNVTIATSDAGATNLTVTNATTASKSLGTLGKKGQPKNDFQFDKDTQFQ